MRQMGKIERAQERGKNRDEESANAWDHIGPRRAAEPVIGARILRASKGETKLPAALSTSPTNFASSTRSGIWLRQSDTLGTEVIPLARGSQLFFKLFVWSAQSATTSTILRQGYAQPTISNGDDILYQAGLPRSILASSESPSDFLDSALYYASAGMLQRRQDD